jgi:hypothetical protein
MVEWNGIHLPGFAAPLAAIERDRPAALAAHLREVLAGVAVPAPATASTSRPAPDPSQANSDRLACSACRGFCCRNGGNTAYLNPRTMARYWSEHPHLTRDEIVSAYVDAVPRTAFEGSCIFHTERGCNLPNRMRSQVCLDYRCAPLRDALVPRS